MSDFSAEFNETIALAVLQGQENVVLHVIHSSNPLQVVVRKGRRRPALFGAMGLALLSCLSPTEQEAYLTPTLPSFTDNTMTDRTKFLARLDQITQRGYVVEYDEYIAGLGGIALSIKRTQPYALTVFGPTDRLRVREGQIVSRLLSLHDTLLQRLPL